MFEGVDVFVVNYCFYFVENLFVLLGDCYVEGIVVVGYGGFVVLYLDGF